MGKIGKVVGGLFAVVVIGSVGAACNSGGDDSMAKPDQAASSKKNDTADAKDTVSQATAFRNCVAKNGTDGEKAAVQHVTKVNGTDKRNDILDAPEVYTDFKGGITSKDQGKAKLLASAFASCYDSDNGLVTIYGADGQVLANGQF